MFFRDNNNVLIQCKTSGTIIIGRNNHELKCIGIRLHPVVSEPLDGSVTIQLKIWYYVIDHGRCTRKGVIICVMCMSLMKTLNNKGPRMEPWGTPFDRGVHLLLTALYINSSPPLRNTLRPRQNGSCFADDTFKRIFLNENVRISIEISLKFVPKGSINNIPASVQIMAWRRSGDKPLSEPMMVSLLTHICVTRPQWVNGRHLAGDIFKCIWMKCIAFD